MPSRTSLATRSVLLLVAAALTAAAVRGARPAPGGAGLRARYGAPTAMGNGQARTYVMVDERSGNPVEVGVALSAQALEALPGSVASILRDRGPGEASTPELSHIRLQSVSVEQPTPINGSVRLRIDVEPRIW